MARVTALFYIAIQYQGLFIIMPDLSNLSLQEYIKSITQAIGCLIPDQFLVIVKDIQYIVFTLETQNGVDSKGYTHGDIKYQTMCCMLQEAKLFFTIQHAIKHTNVNIL